MSMTTPWPVLHTDGGIRETVTDQLVTEGPLEIRLDGTPLAVLMRTPGNDEDLILGFAITEGIALGPSEVNMVQPAADSIAGNQMEIVLGPGVRVDPEQFRRSMFASSSCGVCGKASIDALRVAAPPPPAGPVLTTAGVLRLPQLMSEAQSTFEVTGGLHAAAAFDADGELLAIREDVGRHNAVDKTVGALARRRWPLGELVMLVSGRVSFEVVQKAAVAGIPVVCGVSAASSLAVELADELGITVIGFLREQSFNVYSRPDRFDTT